MNVDNYNIQIAGFEHNITNFRDLIDEVSQISDGCTIQLLNAEGIAGYKHILHATVHAIKSFERGENIAKDLGLEIAVRASAQRQISKALGILGIKKGQINLCAVALNCNEDIMNKLERIIDKRDDDVLIPDEDELKALYDLSDAEITAAGSITNLMMEKTSLLILES